MFKCCIRQRSSRDESLTHSDSSEETSSEDSSDTSSSSSTSTAEKEEPPQKPSNEVLMINRCTSPVDLMSTLCLRCPTLKNECVEKATEYSPQEVKKDVAINCEIIGVAQVDSITIGQDESEKLRSFTQELRQYAVPKLPYSGPAYIERTISDGPEEEGDDSVFESCQAKSIVDESAQKLLPPGCESTGKEEHLEELVIRLENVTSQLEQISTNFPPPVVDTQEIAVQTHNQIQVQSSTTSEEDLPPPPPPPPEQSSDSAPTISPEEQYSPTLSSVSSDSCVASTVVDTIVEITSMSLAGYQDLMVGPIRDYMNLSEKIGGDVAEHSKLVEKAFELQFQFIQMSSSRAAPSQSEQMALLSPTSQQIQQIQEFREKHRGSPFFNHLSAISESIPALGWVAVSPTPAPYVKEMNDAGQFYTNRVLKEWKEKDKTHVEWCKAWVQTLTDLQQYVRAHHTTGLVWAKAGAVGVPPPPPPFGYAPPPPPQFTGEIGASVNDDRSALFAEINQGENITRNLKKVTSDMQTHKNPALRTGPAPFKAPAYANSSSPTKTVLPANVPIDKPPVFKKDGKKWIIEYHKGNRELLIDQTEMNNVIYMFRCQESTLHIKGKVNSIVMDSCRKSSIVFDSVVSSIEFVNCQSVQMQVLGKVPTVSIDKTDGCHMYLNSESTGVEVITSKSSEMNIMIPKGNEGDYLEYPVPEQFKTTIGPKGLNTVAVDSLG